MVVFHDLVSPHVAAGLRALAAQGWNIMAYQTAQMMGVAWRGTIEPVAHEPDPTQRWPVPEHLAGIPISGDGVSSPDRWKGRRAMMRHLFAATLGAALAASAAVAFPAFADDAQIARGRYLVTIAGCSDCHTPGALLGAPDMKRYLGGSDVGFAIPGAGVFVGENLTPDKDTGLGKWTDGQIIAAIRTGKTPEGQRPQSCHALRGVFASR